MAEPDWLKQARKRGLIDAERASRPPTPAKPATKTVAARWSVSAELPLPVTGQALNSREHWAVRAKRTKRERAGVADALAALFGRVPCPSMVRLTILGGRNRIDSDGVVGRLKAYRDGVADWLGIDDGDERIAWEYGHERGPLCGVRVELIGGGTNRTEGRE